MFTRMSSFIDCVNIKTSQQKIIKSSIETFKFELIKIKENLRSANMKFGFLFFDT
jgi:hypothetical protein